MSWQTPEGDTPPDAAAPDPDPGARPPDPAAPEPDAETARVPLEGGPTEGAPASQAPGSTPGASAEPAPQPAPAGLISAAPVGWTGAGQEPPGAPTAAAADEPLVAWAPPVASAAVSVAEGVVIARTFPRVVAYSVDVLILAFANAIVGGLLGTYGQNRDATVALIVSVIFLGLEFLYFVGFWTSGWQATLGMRMLRLRVLGARDAQTLSLNGAVVRWLALSGGLAILALLPGIGAYVGLLSILWVLALLISTANDRLRQGLHDRWAGSVVVAPAPGGIGVAVITCLVLVVFVGVILPVIVLAVAGDSLREILSQVGNSI
jgi:uncharacterized RDD family membrane protein YckC